MKDKRCFICKYHGKIELDTYDNVIYNSKGRNQTISLCYVHSVQFFKMGQTSFMLKYKQDFSHFYGVEDDLAAIKLFT